MFLWIFYKIVFCNLFSLKFGNVLKNVFKTFFDKLKTLFFSLSPKDTTKKKMKILSGITLEAYVKVSLVTVSSMIIKYFSNLLGKSFRFLLRNSFTNHYFWKFQNNFFVPGIASTILMTFLEFFWYSSFTFFS